MAVQKNFVVKNGLEVGESASITGVLVASGITYPTSDGSANQVITTDGTGNLTLQTVDYNNLSNTPNVLDSADVLAAVTADGFTKYDSANASGQITAAINSLIDGAPTALDTLNELAAALNDDSNFAGTITAQIAALPDSAEVSAIIIADVDKAFVDALNVDADTLDNQDGTYYLDYTNFTNTPNVLDSADILAAVTADGFTKYDSANASGQISAALVGYATETYVDNAVEALPDSSQVSLIITADVTQTFVNNLNVDADTLDTQDGTYYLDYANFTNTPNVLDSADVLATVSAGGYATQTYVDNAVQALPDSAQVSGIITADVDKTFIDNLNVDADTLDGQDGTYYLDYTNFTNTPAPGLDSAQATIIAEDVALALSIALG